MRVLAIAPTSFFADYGCHVRIQGQLIGLQRLGHEILLITYPSGRNIPDIPTVRSPWLGKRVIWVGPSVTRLALDALLGPTALRAVRGFRPDVVHAYLHEGALIGAVVARRAGIGMVFDYQGSLTGEMLDHGFLSRRSPGLALLRRLEHWIERRSRVILASSHDSARRLALELGPAAHGWVEPVLDGVDPDHFRPSAAFDPAELEELRTRLAIPPGRRIVAYLGLLASYQGTEFLLEAMALLSRSDPDAHLLLMGFPKVERYRALVAALGLAGRVTVTGVVRYDLAPHHLALAQVAVAPKLSATEGSGKVVAYMAAGLPVVAFDTPAHREYLAHLGVYVPVGDREGLASALGSLLASPGQAALLGQALRERVAEGFTWARIAAQIEGVYRAL